MTEQATAVRPDLAGDVEAYRQALREYLATTGDLDRWRGRHHPSTEERIADHGRFMAALDAGGWNGYGWPAEIGGRGGDPRHRAVPYDELSEAGLPVPEPHLLLETLGPPVAHFAPDLARQYFPAYLRGEEWWGQCFSEPEAGSDLASLRCRARRDGENYMISGSKLWTSHGTTATRIVGSFRTGTPESRHRGLTMIMVDVDSPGLSRRPIALASGMNEVAEIFFDDVVVPASRVVGDEGGGWAVAMFLLQYEPAMYAWLSATVALRQSRELHDQVAGRGPLPSGAERRSGDATPTSSRCGRRAPRPCAAGGRRRQGAARDGRDGG